jgi:elongation factor 1-beta
MGIALIKIKLMPISPETDLKDIKIKAEEAIKETGGEKCNFEEEPVAFGLNAVIAGFALDENKSLDTVEEKLKTIENVNSVQVIDMRRAFG